MKNISQEELLTIKLFQSRLDNIKSKIELIKVQQESLDLQYQIIVSNYNSYMEKIYSKYELSQDDKICDDGKIEDNR